MLTQSSNMILAQNSNFQKGKPSRSTVEKPCHLPLHVSPLLPSFLLHSRVRFLLLDGNRRDGAPVRQANGSALPSSHDGRNATPSFRRRNISDGNLLQRTTIRTGEQRGLSRSTMARGSESSNVRPRQRFLLLRWFIRRVGGGVSVRQLRRVFSSPQQRGTDYAFYYRQRVTAVESPAVNLDYLSSLFFSAATELRNITGGSRLWSTVSRSSEEREKRRQSFGGAEASGGGGVSVEVMSGGGPRITTREC
nr:hypothetical protein Iba_chr09dCG13790 [Ipomoea batatas]